MLKQNWGRIVFMSSESGVQIPSGNGALRNDKDGNRSRWRAAIAESIAGTGVTANSILAGRRSQKVWRFVEAMAKQQNKSKKEMENDFFKHGAAFLLLKRFATVDEVAAMVTYVAGQLSSATNGAALRVDGGVVRAIILSSHTILRLISPGVRNDRITN